MDWTVAGRDAPVLRHAVCGALQACPEVEAGSWRRWRRQERGGASWSSWTRLASTRLTWRFCAPGWSCCVRSSWTFSTGVVEVPQAVDRQGGGRPHAAQVSAVQGVRVPQIQFIDRLWTPQLRAERGTHRANCTENRRDSTGAVFRASRGSSRFFDRFYGFFRISPNLC